MCVCGACDRRATEALAAVLGEPEAGEAAALVTARGVEAGVVAAAAPRPALVHICVRPDVVCVLIRGQMRAVCAHNGKRYL